MKILLNFLMGCIVLGVGMFYSEVAQGASHLASKSYFAPYNFIPSTLGVINDREITRDEFDKYLASNYRKDAHFETFLKERIYFILQKYINDLLLFQAAVAEGVFPSVNSCNNELQRRAAKMPTAERGKILLNLLQHGRSLQGLIEAQSQDKMMQNKLATEIYVDKFIRSKIKVSDEEALVYYQEHLEEFSHNKDPEKSMRISFVLFYSPLTRPEFLRTQALIGIDYLTEGKRFEELPELFGNSEMEVEVCSDFLLDQTDGSKNVLLDQIKDLPIGKISAPLKINDKIYMVVLRENSRNNSFVTPFEEVKEKIIHVLQTPEVDRQISELIAALRRSNHVEVTIPPPENIITEKK